MQLYPFAVKYTSIMIKIPKKLSGGSLILVLVLLIWQSWLKTNPTPTPTTKVESANREITKVTRVVDGDTIEIEGGRKLRYIGMDTPETVDPRKTVQCFGREAAQKNKELVEGKTVELEKDVSETDRYGRLLRYVYVDGQMVNEILVKEGYARAATFPPDVKYQEKFTVDQREAQQGNLGLWSACQ
jgi:micrococcal nuclease